MGNRYAVPTSTMATDSAPVRRARLTRTLRRPPVRWGAVGVWMLLIFALSAQPASQSSGLSGTIVRALRGVGGGLLPGVDWGFLGAGFLETLVRKTAHLLEYAALGALLAWAWRAWPARIAAGANDGVPEPDAESGAGGGGESWPPGAFAWPFLLAVAYAASDEAHQLVVPGRSGQISDVLVDALGAALGVALVTVAGSRRRRRRRTGLSAE